MIIRSRWFHQMGMLTFCGIFILQTTMPMAAFAERISPKIDLESPSETLDDLPETLTGAESIDSEAVLNIQSGNSESPVLKGSVTVDKDFVPDVVFEEEHTLLKGEVLVLTMLDMIATGYNQSGDEFQARLKKPVMQDGKMLIPRGVLIKGHVTSAQDPGKSFSKRAKLVLAFDYILMPDGRKIPFKSDFTKGDGSLKAAGRAVGGGISGTMGGAVKGVVAGLSFGGLVGAALTNGTSLAITGGIGALTGLANGLAKSGADILVNEGDTIKVVLEEPLKLPAVAITPDVQNEIHQPGLNVKVSSYKLDRDPFKVENMIRLQIAVDNQTQYSFGSFDLALEDEYGNVFQISPFGTGDDMYMFQINPQSQIDGAVSFSVKTPDVRHYLVFYKPYTREVIAKLSLTEALKSLSNEKVAKAKRS